MLEEEKNQAPEEEVEEGEVVELDVSEEDQEAQAAVEDVSEEETKKDEEQDELENYSKGVQKRIATLTKKMREQNSMKSGHQKRPRIRSESWNQLYIHTRGRLEGYRGCDTCTPPAKTCSL